MFRLGLRTRLLKVARQTTKCPVSVDVDYQDGDNVLAFTVADVPEEKATEVREAVSRALFDYLDGSKHPGYYVKTTATSPAVAL